MINIEEVLNCPLTSQEIYDMINSCLEKAEDNGFLNQFVFERALVCHEVLLLIDDLDDIDGPMVAENPLTAFDHFLEMGYVQNLIKNHADTVDYISKIAADYYEDYNKYLLSLGGVINKAELLSTDSLNNLTSQFKNVIENGDIMQTLEIAKEWGMDRVPESVAAPVDSKQVLDSLFNPTE